MEGSQKRSFSELFFPAGFRVGLEVERLRGGGVLAAEFVLHVVERDFHALGPEPADAKPVDRGVGMDSLQNLCDRLSFPVGSA